MPGGTRVRLHTARAAQIQVHRLGAEGVHGHAGITQFQHAAQDSDQSRLRGCRREGGDALAVHHPRRYHVTGIAEIQLRESQEISLPSAENFLKLLDGLRSGAVLNGGKVDDQLPNSSVSGDAPAGRLFQHRLAFLGHVPDAIAGAGGQLPLPGVLQEWAGRTRVASARASDLGVHHIQRTLELFGGWHGDGHPCRVQAHVEDGIVNLIDQVLHGLTGPFEMRGFLLSVVRQFFDDLRLREVRRSDDGLGQHRS